MREFEKNPMNKSIEWPVVFVCDFDGPANRSIKAISALTIEIMMRRLKNYGINYSKAQKLTNQIMYYGGDIFQRIKDEFPNAPDQEINDVMEEYFQRAKKDIYDKSEVCPDFCELLDKCYEQKSYVYISSLASVELIEYAFKKSGNGILTKIEKIYGDEHGPKANHFKEIRERHPESLVIFITDGVNDAKEDADIIFGIVNDGDKQRTKMFMECENYDKNKYCFVKKEMGEIVKLLKDRNFIPR